VRPDTGLWVLILASAVIANRSAELQPSSWQYHRCRTLCSVAIMPSWRPNRPVIGGISADPAQWYQTRCPPDA
jgi:hypothetical protein